MQIKREKSNKLERCLLIITGTFLVAISFLLVGIKYHNDKTKEYEENKKIEEFLEEEKEKTEDIKTETTTSKKSNYKYIAVLEIPTLNLKRGLVSKENYSNNVNSNIMIVKESDMPDIDKGNLILAAHAGTSSISFFKNLNQMKLNDLAHVYYNHKKYTYKVINIYDIKKTGTAEIIRNKYKNTLTLISCRSGTKYQIVVVCELIKIENL